MEKISRTQKKKAAQALQKIGEQLVQINQAQFEALELPDELRQAAAMARQIKSREARRRQIQYIGRLMREFDADLVARALEKIKSGEVENKRKFKMVERWREELVSGDKERLIWLIDQYPNIDPEELKLMIENAQGRHPGVNPRNAGRMLFRFLNKMVSI